MDTICTIVYSQSGRLIISKTLQETAIWMTSKRGAFHVKDILIGLKIQASALEKRGKLVQAEEVRAITEQQIRNQLYYSEGKGPRRKRVIHEINKLKGGWFTWVKYEYNPFADESKGEAEIRFVK